MTEDEIQQAVEDAINEASEELYYEGKTLTLAQCRGIEAEVRRRCEKL